MKSIGYLKFRTDEGEESQAVQKIRGRFYYFAKLPNTRYNGESGNIEVKVNGVWEPSSRYVRDVIFTRTR